jgi:uncharacterized protein DUF6941
MRLDAFLLADVVTAPPDGKVYVHGGGLTRITAPVLPFTLPQLGILARFAIEASELERPHDFAFSLTDADGNDVIPPGELRSAPIAPPEVPEGEEHYLQLALNLTGITFPTAGVYHFELRADGEPVKTMTLPVVPMQTAPASDAPAQPTPTE